MTRVALISLGALSSAADSHWKVRETSICKGEQTAFVPCENQPECFDDCTPRDCQVGAWHAWGNCTCHTGLRQRSRVIIQRNNGCGTPCRKTLVEADNCKKTRCLPRPVDCTLSQWSQWSTCESAAPNPTGKGGAARAADTQTFRSRNISVQSEYGGKNCSRDTLQETKACPQEWLDFAQISCRWNDWSEWGACSRSCNIGQQIRNRSIAQNASGYGKLCRPLSKSQVAPCNTQSCATICIDGSWGDWHPWTPCNVTCGGGISWRRRTIAQTADACGQPALGIDHDVKICSSQSCHPKDCQLSAWGDWSHCSTSCAGARHRNRNISHYGEGDGRFCSGAMKEIQACNNYRDVPGNCTNGEPVNCEVSPWSEWSMCSHRCGQGQRHMDRHIIHQARHRGQVCTGNVSVTGSCWLSPCGRIVPKVPCQWNGWSDWGDCNKCGGQRKRYRTIRVPAKHGGHNCDFAASVQMTNCSRQCHRPVFCAWADWQSVGNCSTSCGGGFVKRQRRLAHASKPPTEDAQVLYDSGAPTDRLYGLQDLLLSFSCGGLLAFLGLMATGRLLRSRPGAKGWATRGWSAEPVEVFDIGEDERAGDVREMMFERPHEEITC